MDPSFEKLLLDSGIGSSVVRVLQSQKIYSLRVFRAMKEQHLVGLLKCEGMPIGIHALLWEMWEEYGGCLPSRSFEKVSVSTPRQSALSTASSSSSLTTTPPEDRKELFKRYQQKMKEMKKSKRVEGKAATKTIHIHLGGMIFDDELQKGVKKRYIPPPMNVSFPGTATYDDVISSGRENFFPDENTSADTFCLCDSSGTPFKVDNPESWVLSEFVQTTGQPPSKLRLYVMWQPKEEEEAEAKHGDDVGSDDGEKHMVCNPPPLVKTSDQAGFVMKNCSECQEAFRTYVPGVDTLMPDGTSFFYSSPQNLCPGCDPSNWGWQWNQDLFPQFADRKIP